MTTAATIPTVATPAWQLWTGRVLSALPVLMLVFSGSMKLARTPAFVEAWAKFGYPASAAVPIGILEIACALLYAIPRTRVLGAILVTTYLGGAVATHVRVSDVFVAPVVLGIFVWAGLVLREPRLRELLPLVKK